MRFIVKDFRLIVNTLPYAPLSPRAYGMVYYMYMHDV